MEKEIQNIDFKKQLLRTLSRLKYKSKLYYFCGNFTQSLQGMSNKREISLII